MLAGHPNRQLVEFFIAGLTDGFRIGFKEQPKPLWSAKRNLSCAFHSPEVFDRGNHLWACSRSIPKFIGSTGTH